MVDISQHRGTAPAWWPALAVALGLAAVTVATGLVIESLQRDSALEHERSHVLGQLSQIRARLENTINGNLLAIRGLSTVISAQPDITQQAFARIAGGLLSDRQSLLNIAGAPGLVVSLMYPMADNEAALGLDYRHHPTQREAALRAVESGQTVLAGPLNLIQGGVGLIAHEPVYVSTAGDDMEKRLWGLVSAVLDAERLYELAGLTGSQHHDGLAIAIRGRDGLGEQGEPFYGDATLFGKDAITLPINLAGGAWQIAAMPKDGWGSTIERHEGTLIRAGTAMVALVLAIMGFLLTRATQQLRATGSELAKSQAIFSSFMRHLPAGAFVHDPATGEIVFENAWMKNHLSQHRGECGSADDDLQALESGPRRDRHDVFDDSGSSMHCETLRFVLDAADHRKLVAGVVMDISERIKAERRLADNQARLRTLLNTVPDLVWLKDTEGRYLACNKRFEAFFGAREKQIIGKTDYDFVDPSLADFFRAKDLAAIDADKPLVNEETVVFASDGHEEQLETIKAPVRDEAGTLIGVLGIARDITERKRAEAEVREVAERLAAAERVAQIGSWEYIVAEDRLTCSDETYRLFALDPDASEIDRDWIRSRVNPDDLERYREHEQLVLNAAPDDPRSTVSFRMLRADCEERILSMQLGIQFDLHDKPARIFGTIQDVTDSERLNQDLQARLNELTRWQSVILGREDRVRDLKREVNALLLGNGQAPRYPSQEHAS